VWTPLLDVTVLHQPIFFFFVITLEPRAE
jgi:hypothetical protein